jgi:hypothetical protein
MLPHSRSARRRYGSILANGQSKPCRCTGPALVLQKLMSPTAPKITLFFIAGNGRRNGSVRPSQPIIRNFKNIECRDAPIACPSFAPVQLNPS